jgi:hypothetical protein
MNLLLFFFRLFQEIIYLETTLLKHVLELFTLNANNTFDANYRTC